MRKVYTVYLLTGNWKGELGSFRSAEEARSFAFRKVAEQPRYAGHLFVRHWARFGWDEPFLVKQEAVA